MEEAAIFSATVKLGAILLVGLVAGWFIGNVIKTELVCLAVTVWFSEYSK